MRAGYLGIGTLWCALWALGLSPVARAADSHCMAPAFEWLPRAPVTKLTHVFKECHETAGPTLLATRHFEKQGNGFYLLVDADTLETSIAPDRCVRCENTEPVKWGNTRFIKALQDSTAPGKSIQNVGVRHADHPVDGYFVTVDLCPSRKPGFDEAIFTALEKLAERKAHLIPVAISVSGYWITGHRGKFEWLLEQQARQLLRITWVNHTMTHPYNRQLPDEQNFLLEKGVSIEREILGLERLLLEYGVVPSVYFRFPGLVGSRALDDSLRNYCLIPIASDAWLAKKERPTPGSVILIHGNENEPAGVADFLKWLDLHRGDDLSILGLADLFQ